MRGLRGWSCLVVFWKSSLEFRGGRIEVSILERSSGSYLGGLGFLGGVGVE